MKKISPSTSRAKSNAQPRSLTRAGLEAFDMKKPDEE
jgi:hypothetical protein